MRFFSLIVRIFRNGLISISDWVFGHVWSCLTLFIIKTSYKSDELKTIKKGGVHKSGTYIVNGCITFLKFIVLPFGLSTACYLFTKLTRLV
jgi:hypothetical protein